MTGKVLKKLSFYTNTFKASRNAWVFENGVIVDGTDEGFAAASDDF